MFVLITSLAIGQNINIDITSFTLTGTTNDFSVEGLSYVTNNVGTSQNLRWRRVVQSAPSAWTATVCDMNNCYGPSTDHMDFTLANGSNGLLRLDVLPNNVAGTGVYKMLVYSITDSANVNAVITYDVTITQFNTVTTVASIQGIGLYPNPAKTFLKVTTSSNLGASKIEVYNLLGDKVSIQSVQSGTNEFSVNVSNLMNGTYFLHVIMSDGSLVTRKFNKN